MPQDWWEGQGIKSGVSRMFCDNVKEWVKWRTEGNGKIKRVEVTDVLDGITKYRVVIMNSAKEIPVDLTVETADLTCSTSSGLGQLQLPDVHVNELPDEDEDGDAGFSVLAADSRPELEKMLAEEEQFSEQPVDSRLTRRISEFVAETLQNFNNSESA